MWHASRLTCSNGGLLRVQEDPSEIVFSRSGKQQKKVNCLSRVTHKRSEAAVRGVGVEGLAGRRRDGDVFVKDQTHNEATGAEKHQHGLARWPKCCPDTTADRL